MRSRGAVRHLGVWQGAGESRTKFDHTGAGCEHGRAGAESTSLGQEHGVANRKEALGR